MNNVYQISKRIAVKNRLYSLEQLIESMEYLQKGLTVSDILEALASLNLIIISEVGIDNRLYKLSNRLAIMGFIDVNTDLWTNKGRSFIHMILTGDPRKASVIV